MKKAGIPCPEVVILKKHILVMSFIGQNQVPAPKLKDAMLTSEDMNKAYYQVLQVYFKIGQIYVDQELQYHEITSNIRKN